MTDSEVKNLKNIIDQLWTKYENEPQVINKLINTICVQLPVTLEHTHNHIIEKKTKKNNVK